MTHAELVAQVIEDCGRSDKTTEIGKYVNRAQVIIVQAAYRIHKHVFTSLIKEKYRDTVDGTKTYAFPSDMFGFYNIRMAESGDKRRLSDLTPHYQDLRRPYPEDETEGAPKYYIPWGRYFELSPIPDAAYTLFMRCAVYPADMATAETSDLLYMDEVIIKCADWFTCVSLNLEKDIRRFKGEFKDLLDIAIKADIPSFGGDKTVRARPFTATRIYEGDLDDYWKKPSWRRGPG